MSSPTRESIRSATGKLSLEQKEQLYAILLQQHNSQEDLPDTKQLVAHIVPESNSEPQTNQITSRLLQEKLPSFMVPKEFVIHRTLPTNTNGKIDRKQLTDSQAHSASSSLPIDKTEPTSRLEFDLLAIWKKVLSLRDVKRDEDFFQLGGDSISAIQVVSECRKKGIDLSVSVLFKYTKISNLAQFLGDKIVEKPKASQQSNVHKQLLSIWRKTLQIPDIDEKTDFFEAGGDSILAISLVSEMRKSGFNYSISELFKKPSVAELCQDVISENTEPSPTLAPELLQSNIPFTPIQSWFFEQDFCEPNHWNQSILLKLPKSTAYSEVEHAIQELYRVNDALRLSIIKTPTGLKQSTIPFSVESVPSTEIEIEDYADKSELESVAANAQTSLRLDSGQLLKSVFIKNTEGAFNLLLLVAHHICIDAVSWNILLTDLGSLLSRKLDLLPEKPSFAQWANEITKVPTTQSYWDDTNALQCPTIPFEKGKRELNTEGSARTVKGSLSIAVTTRLIKNTNTREDSIQSYIIASIGQTMAKWLNSSKLLLGIEGHGRAMPSFVADSSSLLGWLTSYHPFVLDLEYAKGPANALYSTQTQLSHIADDGSHYGIERYIKLNPKHISFPEPEITINYLGNQDHTSNDTSTNFPVLKTGVGVDRDPKNKRTALFEINAFVDKNQLHLSWSYSSNLFFPKTIDKLMHATVENLEEMIESRENQTQFPLSDPQEALLLHRLSDLKNDQGTLLLCADLLGKVSKHNLEQAWKKVVQNHPSLNAIVHLDKNGVPKIKIPDETTFGFEYHTLENSHTQSKSDAIARIQNQFRSEILDIQNGPSSKLCLIRLDESNHRLYWKCHHIFLDGWSSSIVLGDLLACLNNVQLTLDSDRRSFEEYQNWKRRIPIPKHAFFWKEYLKESEPSLIGNGVPLRQKSARFSKTTILNESIQKKLKDTSARYKTSPGAIATGAWAIVIGELTKLEKVTFASTFSGRNLPIDNIESLAANLANIAPINIDLGRRTQLSEWLNNILQDSDTVSEHAYFSIANVLNWAEKPQLFDSSFTVANYPWEPANEGVRLEKIEGATTSTFPLSGALNFDRQLSLAISADTRFISETLVDTVIKRYTQAIESICSTEFTKVGECIDLDIEYAGIHPSLQCDTNKLSKEQSQSTRPNSTADQVVQIFRRILDTEEVESNDSFFDLGGTSTQAVQLFRELEDFFGEKLLVSTLFNNQSPLQLSQLLSGTIEEKSDYKSLVNIRPGNGLPPIFLIHAGGMEILFYRELAKALDPRLPIYGLQPIGLDGSEKPLDDINEIAARYNAEILSQYPSGPYTIVGHCIGGTIAIAMANQLQTQNRKVTLVVSIDGPAPRTQKQDAADQATPQRIRSFLSNAKRMVLPYFQGSKAKHDAHIYKLRRAYWKAASDSICEPCPLKVVILNSQTNGSAYQDSNAWKNAVPNAEFHYIDCPHDDILKGQNALEVAERITTELNARYYQGELSTNKKTELQL